jgi:hypothetical protein
LLSKACFAAYSSALKAKNIMQISEKFAIRKQLDKFLTGSKGVRSRNPNYFIINMPEI